MNDHGYERCGASLDEESDLFRGEKQIAQAWQTMTAREAKSCFQ
jgi:hypothetical protein